MDKENNIDNDLKRFIFIETMNDHYYSPPEIKYRTTNEFKDEKLLEFILALRAKRLEALYTLSDQQGRSFQYWSTPRIEKMLHEIDIQRAQWQEVQNPSVLGDLLLRNLIDEAYYSSWIEGAKTTHKRAREMIHNHEKPKDRSERMVLNNFRTMEFLLKNLQRPLDHEFVCELHKIVTEATLDPEDEPFSGRYRNDQVVVWDEAKQKVDYTAPPASEVPKRMQDLYNWSNLEGVEFLFLHPVIKASIIHFYTVYVHPFFDGNGRTARALMYYYLLKHDYDFMKFFSISKAIAANRKSYYQAILNVEAYDSDLTYFLLYSVKMVLEAISVVASEKRNEETLADWLDKIKSQNIILNPRQEKLFQLHFRNKLLPITIKKYLKIMKVVYETGRSDLTDLCDKGLLQMSKKGKEFVFDFK